MVNEEDFLLETQILKSEIQKLKSKVKTMQESSCWKITYPYRRFADFIKCFFVKDLDKKLEKDFEKELDKDFDYRKTVGFFKKERLKLFWNLRHGDVLPYQAFGLCRQDWIDQKNKVFNSEIHFSVVAVLFNPNEQYFREMIHSLFGQTYKNWDLTLLDFSTEEHQKIDIAIKEFADKDSRISYKKFEPSADRTSEVNRCAHMAKGKYVFVLNQNDILHPSAFYEFTSSLQDEDYDFIYADEAAFANNKLHDITETYFKPDFAPEYFYSTNFMRHCVLFKKELLNEIKDYDILSSYDLYIKFMEKTERVFHLAKCLYFERELACSGESDAFFPKEDGVKSLTEHFERAGIEAEVSEGKEKNCYRVKYCIKGQPLVSIIIPNYDHWKTLKVCLESIKKSTWQNYEIIIIENNSKDPETFKYYESLKSDPKIKILYWEKGFNYSAINNFGFEHTKGDYILLLNNDVEVINENWIEEMLMYSQQNGIGAVGAKLYFPSGKIQHGGVIVTNLKLILHSFKDCERNSTGYNFRLSTVQNYSAVTAACMMIPRDVYIKVGGLNEIYQVAFNDVDLCIKIRQAGYRIVWTPYAELYHYESESRGQDDTMEKIVRSITEVTILRHKWAKMFANGDPYYNINLSKECNFKLKYGSVFF